MIPLTTPVGDRSVRVFISSTFRDMQEEREELVKRVFPQIRRLCEERRVVWGEVDLRWGVTDEQKAEGQVLPICLAEIARCRPYFIGLLGERYGWLPETIAPALVASEPWLAECRDRSVTELEILHGVLNHRERVGRAFFYFRDPRYVDAQPPLLQLQLRETPDQEEIRRFGTEAANRRACESTQKLAALKERIRQSGHPVRDGYADPRALGELVLADLTAMIEQQFPPGSVPEPLDRESAQHEAFCASRSQAYIGRRTYLRRLTAHARGRGQPLVVVGASGSGKSALLAKWGSAQETRAADLAGAGPALWQRLLRALGLSVRTQADTLVVMHFIGATPESSDWAAMLRRIIALTNRHFGLQQDLPSSPDLLRQAFAAALHAVAARGRAVLVLDGLDQLEDRDQAPDLVWLPSVIPPNIRLMVSTLPGRSLTELQKRGWPVVQVEPLTPAERKRFIAAHLAQYTKTLSSPQVGRIAAAEQTANPLFLSALLEELRMHGDHYSLNQRIGHYLGARGVPDLYQKILERYEHDYERDQPGLVKQAMSLVWAARRGVSERELLDLLGTENEPMPLARWSPLHLAAGRSLSSRAGLIGFGHDYLRQAVRDRYLAKPEMERQAHLRLADYFVGQDVGPRMVDELPWQLAQAEAHERLYCLLADLSFLEVAWQEDQFGVRRYWAQIEARSSLRLVDAYRPVLSTPAWFVRHAWVVLQLLRDEGYLADAQALSERLAHHARKVGDAPGLRAALSSQGLIRQTWGDLNEALALYRDLEDSCREAGDAMGLQASLLNQGTVHYARGDLMTALRLFREQEHICKQLGDTASLAASYNHQALVRKNQGDLAGALSLHSEEERIYRASGDQIGLQACLGNIGLLRYALGELDQAMALYEQQERICRDLGFRSGLCAALGNRALLLRNRGCLDEAMALHLEQERLYIESGDRAGIQTCIGNRGLILYLRGELDGAMELYRQQEVICRELGNMMSLQVCLGNQGLVHGDRGELDQAMSLHLEKERLCRELGNLSGLQVSLGNQVQIHIVRAELDEATYKASEQEHICRELGNQAGLQKSLGNQGDILAERGDFHGAMKRYLEQERICRELGYMRELHLALGNRGGILTAAGNCEKAMALHQEQERICRKLGDKVGLARSWLQQAKALVGLEQRRKAISLANQAKELAAELHLVPVEQGAQSLLEALLTP